MYVLQNSGIRPSKRRLSSTCRRCQAPNGRGLGILQGSQAQIANAAASALATIGGPIGAAIASVGLLLANAFSGCGQSCVDATNIVNQVGPLLGQNVSAYINSPTRTQSMQAAALNNFDTTWAKVVQACQTIGGQGGAGCLSDRQQGACSWKTSPQGWAVANGICTWTAPGANGSGTACANWFTLYRDPIANDPCVVSDASLEALTGAAGSSIASALGIPASVNFSGLLIPAALVGAGLLLFNGKN